MKSFAIALNCQLMTAVTNDEIQMREAIARRYDEENTSRMLFRRFWEPAESTSFGAVSATAWCCFHTMITSIGQSARNTAIPSSRLSVPNALAAALEKKPAKIPPVIAPL